MSAQIDMNPIDVFQMLKHISDVDEEGAKYIFDLLARIGDMATKADLEAAIKKLADKVERLAAATKADLEKSTAATKAEIQALRTETKAEMKDLVGKIEKLETATKADLKTAVQALVHKIEKLEAATKADLKTAVQALVHKIEKLEAATKAEMKGLADRLEKSEAATKELADKIDVIRTDMAQMTSRLTLRIVLIGFGFSSLILTAIGIMFMYLPKVPLS